MICKIFVMYTPSSLFLVFKNIILQLVSLIILFPFSDQVCIHCNSFRSCDVEDIVNHCRTCSYMPRPDKFRCKFVCYACTSYYTYSSSAIKNHIRIHLEDKPFACTLCNYRCVQKIQLKSHLKSCNWARSTQVRVLSCLKFI